MKLFTIILTTSFVAMTVQSIFAFDLAGGNALWGSYAIQTCRSCHKEKKVAPLEPQNRSVEEWEEFFVNDYLKLKKKEHDFAAVGISDKQIENVHKYLVENAIKKEATVGTTATRQKIIPQHKIIISNNRAISKKQLDTKSSKGNEERKDQGSIFKLNQSIQSTSKDKYSDSSKKKEFDMTAGNARKGGYIFRKCLACHKKNKAPVISPGDRPKKLWSRFFARDFRKFKKYMPEFDTYKFTTSQMEHLHQFLLKYALDADKPKKCK